MSDFSKIYFLGIGGIGMSAIARYYKRKGYPVAGYDRTPSDLTKELEEEGISVHYTDDYDYIPKDVTSTLVVYTPAIPDDLGEFVYVREHGYTMVKRSRMLGELSYGQTCLAVAGTHGKTTTSTLVAHIMTEAGPGCSAFLGGISKNYGTNLLVSQNRIFVAEADEFDRSFLQLHPTVAVITAMDADHLDIYGTLEEYQKAFKTFASQVTREVIVKKGLDITPEDTKARILTYSYDDPSADYHAAGARPDKLGHYIFDLVYPGGVVKDVRCGIPGWVNVENSVAAAAVCLSQGVNPEAVKAAIGTYLGVKRRLDVHVASPELTYIDDYAHHPRELSSAISSIKAMYPGRKLTAVFQPHLYTRTRDFAEDFAKSLSAVDKLILLDIYPAREEPIPGVTSKIIFDKVTAPEKVMLKKEELMEYINKEPLDVLATFGAGNIDRFVAPLAESLEERIRK
ncbi:MAG: UDP-N-acetylmuramate--L-alanine ligase [Bacteroidales bacterium]|nr:UDP-N-acetylmuramate--L-alanine ligase [Bacteroidales bacterium]